MAFLTAHAVKGAGALAELVRMGQYAATPRPGIVLPTHCRLVALSATTVGLTPGTVVVSAGGSGSARWQSYVVAVDATDGDATASVSMPSSSSRRLHAVVTVPDPVWAGVPEPAPGDLGKPVLRLLTTAQRDALAEPWEQVAEVNIPASATGLTQAMVSDQRRMSTNYSWEHSWSYRQASGATADQMDNNGGAGERWPDPAESWVDVPEWATEMHAVVMFAQVNVPAGLAHGYLGLRIGSLALPTTYFQQDEGTSTKQTMIAAGRLDIPADMRGTRQLAWPWARSDGPSRPNFGTASSLAVSLTFKATPV